MGKRKDLQEAARNAKGGDKDWDADTAREMAKLATHYADRHIRKLGGR